MVKKSSIIGLTLLHALSSGLLVIWFWAGTRQMASPTLPALHSHAETYLFLSVFALALTCVDFIFFGWIVLGLGSTARQATTGTRNGRVASGTKLAQTVAVIEVISFRLIWSLFQTHPNAGVSPSLTPVVNFEIVGALLVTVGLIAWMNRGMYRRIALYRGESLEPVVAITRDGALLLADGSTIPMLASIIWPKRKVKVVAVSAESGMGEIYITEDGESLRPQKLPREFVLRT